ncbi:uncharacterized protein LOC130675604 [Microplitis mediator]|uniref:uncharacterized protein LOC130675604 n=1 Tax=Microplitis mediator TaxID=375433 RepID=UPI002555CD62|nr:uncharacterized protein LOC130675604 [Microplitis mediator]
MNLRGSLFIWMIAGFIVISLTTDSSLADVADENKNKQREELLGVVRTASSSTTERNLGVGRESGADYGEEDEDTEDVEAEGPGKKVSREKDHVDEYEEELRSIAESHEAMSRDERSNSSDSLSNSETSVSSPSETLGTRNFDSYEKNIEESSDESMTSNEAISGEVSGPITQELLKFKRQTSGKIKRVPTVKKELSSQIRLQRNDTNEDAVKGSVSQLLGKKVTGSREKIDNDLLDDDGINAGESYLERRSLDGEREAVDEEEYMDLDAPTEILGKLDKRQQSDLKGLETYLEPATHTSELEKLRKLEELRAEEYILAENLMELLVKLAENPKRWERTHKLLRDMENDLELWRASDSSKRGYDFRQALSLSTDSPLIEKLKPETEKPKKKKKKKKKPRYHQLSTEMPSTSTITTTTTPSTTTTTTKKPTPAPAPTPTSTEATRWRIFPDLFGSPIRSSQPGLHKEPSNLAKIHYAVSGKYQKPSLSSNNRDDNTAGGYLNDAVPGILDSSHGMSVSASGKYPLSRKFHFGKINTHEKDSPLNQHDSEPSIYEADSEAAVGSSSPRLLDYQMGGRGVYHHEQPSRARANDRFDRYRPPYVVGERVRNQALEDYQDTLGYPSNEFSRHQGPYGKSWKYSKYNLSPPVDPYYEDERSNWATRYRAWQTFWRPIFEIEDEDEAKRRMLFGKFPSSSSSSSASWSPDKSMQIPPWRSIDDSPRSKGYNRELAVGDKNKNHSEFNEAFKSSKQTADENVALPKITMKTWNSLTSDPATWPFKLSDAKPWPKDKNGKSYNPNADLVRKLGLDKQERLLDKDDDKKSTGDQIKNTSNNIKDNSPSNSNPWTSDRKMWPMKMSPKIQSVGAWVMPADEATWTSYNQQQQQQQSLQHPGTSRWSERPNEANWQSKLTNWNVEFAKQPSHSGPDTAGAASATWPPKWKQFSYHKVNSAPISKSGSTPEEAGSRTRNAFIAVSAVSPSKYPGNEWRKNDIEENFVDNPLRTGVIDRDDPTSQLLHSHWQHQQTQVGRPERRNQTDPLEYQLEELRQNNIEKRSAPTQATLSTTQNTSPRPSAVEKPTKVTQKLEKFPSKPIKE